MKDKYLSISSDVPIFLQPWWLDAVVENHAWDVALIEEDGELEACFVYVLKKKGPFTAIGMPGLTPYLGFWFAKDVDRSNAAKQLIAMLPKHDKFYMQLNYQVFDTEIIAPKIHKQVLHTYILSGIEDHDQLYSNFKQRIKGEIKKAQTQIQITESNDIDGLFKLCQMSYDRQGKKIDFSLDLVRNIYQTVIENKSGTLLMAQDSKGQVHAATLLAWDKDRAYYLLNGGNPELRSSGANSLLMWEAIRHASKFTDKFDFEGSMIPGVEKYIQGYSPEKKQYGLYMYTSSKLLAAAEGLRGAFGSR